MCSSTICLCPSYCKKLLQRCSDFPGTNVNAEFISSWDLNARESQLKRNLGLKLLVTIFFCFKCFFTSDHHNLESFQGQDTHVCIIMTSIEHTENSCWLSQESNPGSLEDEPYAITVRLTCLFLWLIQNAKNQRYVLRFFAPRHRKQRPVKNSSFLWVSREPKILPYRNKKLKGKRIPSTSQSYDYLQVMLLLLY